MSASTKSPPKPVKDAVYQLSVHRQMVGGFRPSGQVSETYTRDISGAFIYQGRHHGRYHFYNGERGIDIYLDADQLDAAMKGEAVVAKLNQWA